MRPFAKIWVLPMFVICFLRFSTAFAQTYPEQSVNQSYTAPSPNSQAIQAYGIDPVALYNGTPSISLPVYTVKCGSLTLPITLSYNYNGLFPLQDAGWVGLGWSLNAGGAITRMVEGGVDYSEDSGYNYDQYNLSDSLPGAHNLAAFLQSAYNNNLGYSGQSYDLAPDIYDAEFCGYSDRWLWYKGKAYLDRWDKDFSVSWPSHGSTITITTSDGVIYTFSATETTTDNYYGGNDSTHQSYTSAWYLSSIQSADHKDTIFLNYASYTWQQQQVQYQTAYGVSAGSQGDLGLSPLSYFVTPSVSTVALQSITCRSSRVTFIPDTAARPDISGTLPRLREIDVIDSVSGVTIKKNTFSYEYFGATTLPHTSYQRLALKTFSSTNPDNPFDSLTYVFKYINEYGSFPNKAGGMDYWGYANGSNLIWTILPPDTSPYYSPSTTDASVGSLNRNPNFTYSSMGALDTLVYPTGGYTAFQYEQNQFYTTWQSLGNTPGPGICVQSVSTVSNNPTSPQIVTKNYTYLQDNGTYSSGVLSNTPSYPGIPFVWVDSPHTYNYLMYSASTNSAGVNGVPDKFFYSKVSESVSANGETHRSDHYFGITPEVFEDVRQTSQVDYINLIGTTIFTPVTKTVTNYATSTADTSFTGAEVFIDTEYTNGYHSPSTWYSYQGFSQSQNLSWWVRPASQVTTQYDINNDSIVTTLTYNFNSTTRNLTSITQNTSDGQTIKQKFKYPEDYSSGLTGNMVAARVLRPVIEKQTWMYPSSGDSLLISGVITQYNQTFYKPDSTYSIELTKSIPVLNNETISGGHYTTLLSDSRYVMKETLQYDGNDNLNVATKSADMPISYIWDYHKCLPIATVKNAVQADIAYTSFEADGTGNWTFTGTATANSASPTGAYCYNLGQTSGNITKSGLTSTTYYIVSYWTQNTSPLSISGTVSGYPVQGKTINGWTYYEHKITGQTSVTISGTGYIDELRLYPAIAQMTTSTYQPSVGVSSQCDQDNRVTYYLYDGFNRLKAVKDQDLNIIKTYQYYTQGECGNGCYSVAMQTLLGTNTLSYPVGVFDVHGNLLGQAANAAQYIGLWNNDTADSRIGTLGTGQDSMHFSLALNAGQTMIAGVTGCRYYQYDLSWNILDAVNNSNGAYVDFGDGTGMHLAPGRLDTPAVLAPNTTVSLVNDFYYYSVYSIHTYADTSLKTITIYHNDDTMTCWMDNAFNPATSLTKLKNFRGNMPQNTTVLAGSSYQQSSASTVTNITNWNSISSVKEFNLNSGDGTNLFLNVGYAQDFMKNNTGLSTVWTYDCGDSTFKLSRLKSGWNTYFTNLTNLAISDITWNRESLSALTNLSVFELFVYTNGAGVIDSVINQIAAGSGQFISNGVIAISNPGFDRTSASQSGYLFLKSKNWTIKINGVDE
jgi:hypothetical protein